MRGSHASFSSKVIFLKLETMVSPVIRYVDVRKTVGDFHIRSRPEESPRLQSVGLCCVPNLQKQRRLMSLTETCSTLILKFLFNNVYKSCSVSFYKMQCFYAAALTLNECALCPFSEAACQSGIFIIKTMLTILNQQSHTSFFHIIQLLHAAMQSRNEQVPGDFSLGETVRSKKAQNKTIQNQKLYLAFLHSITLTEMISTCNMFTLILFALKGHLTV